MRGGGVRWAAALLGAAVFVALAGGTAVRAESGASVTEFGWWSRAPAATTPAGGGFEIADSPAGQLSVAAIRINVTASSLSSAKLVLPENQQVGAGIMQVCPTTSPWRPESPGMFDQAPKPDCQNPIAMVRDAGGTAPTWTAEVLPLLSGGPREVSLMVVPGPPSAPLPAAAPFVVSLRGADLFSEAGSALPDVAPSPEADTSFDSTFGAASSVGSPSDFGQPAPLPQPAAPAVPESEQIVAAPAQTAGRFPTRGDVGTPGGGADQPWGRLPLLTLAAAAVGAVSSVGRTQLRARGLLPA